MMVAMASRHKIRMVAVVLVIAWIIILLPFLFFVEPVT